MASKDKNRVSVPGNSATAEFIRRFKTHPFLFTGTIIVLVIVIVAFVFVPAIVPSAGASVDFSFGSYNKIPINYVPGNYFSQIREMIARYRQSSTNDTNYQIVSYQVWREAFEETVIHTAILDEMNRAGYKVPQEVVDREVAQLPQFQENGRFSTAKYRALDNTSRMALWRQVQDSIAKEYYRRDIEELHISSQEKAFIRAMASPKRTFSMAVLPLRGYPDTELTAYAKAQEALFRVTHLSCITITSNEREAQQILTSISDGTSTFEEAAQTYSQDSYAERGGDMGLKMAYELSSEVPDEQERESLINLAKGELSALVKVPTGWAFFRAEDAPYPADTADAALLEKVRTYVMEFERGRVEDYFIAEAEAFRDAVSESSFADALIQKGLLERNFGPLPLNYGEVPIFTGLSSFSVPELSGAGSNEYFWQTAFSTPLQTPSQPLVIGNTVLVLYPTEESSEDESAGEYIETAYASYWMSSFISQNLRNYFLTSNKLDDRFFDIYFKYIQPLD
ncbi:MAG: SurA N-terminal domain-containing protein [Treponema sp.]|jgi:parvulin-like peptidyl-prolyl isomerase|nr:SurA N-terminal domain-containing protein [Treponema sp.]